MNAGDLANLLEDALLSGSSSSLLNSASSDTADSSTEAASALSGGTDFSSL